MNRREKKERGEGGGGGGEVLDDESKNIGRRAKPSGSEKKRPLFDLAEKALNLHMCHSNGLHDMPQRVPLLVGDALCRPLLWS